MSRSDVFALKNTGLNSFLFADVGIESNGSILTVLSVLARLGQDPWTQAAQWVKLPKTEIIDRLASCIAQMPLPPQSLLDARQTAARLITLLPAQVNRQGHAPQDVAAATPSATPWMWPKWAAAAVIVAMLALSVGSSVLMSASKVDTAAAPAQQTEPLSPSVPSN